MSNGFAIHIGINSVDQSEYGTDGALVACENDALAMQNISLSLGYRPILLATKQATSANFFSAARLMAKQMQRGDTFLFTASCHGDRDRDDNRDEEDGRDEFLCFYDKRVRDDRFADLWYEFPEGSRIIAILDCCHSKTMMRDIRRNTWWASHIGKKVFPARVRKELKSTVITIAGCKDNQYSMDGEINGAFTTALLDVWNNGAFTGTLRQLHSAIWWKFFMKSQTPCFDMFGAKNREFQNAQAFRLT